MGSHSDPDPTRLRYLAAMGIQRWVPRDNDGSENWDTVEARAHACQACPLSQGRRHVVFGTGDRTGDWMVIGEAPGAEEDRLGLPFVGPAGRLLDAMLQAIDLDREQVYIANVLKCRPPGNRNPLPEEVAACGGYLAEQIKLLQPAVILALGRFAAQFLLGGDRSIASLRGRQWTYEGGASQVVVTYHPSYLLRSPREKGKAWQDLCLARRTWLAARTCSEEEN